MIQGYSSLNLEIMNSVYSSMGKNNNFACSHTDSLIGVTNPTIRLFPDQS